MTQLQRHLLLTFALVLDLVFSFSAINPTRTTSTQLVEMLEQKAKDIITSFQPKPFDPWITDCHVQTIGGFFLRDTPAAYLPADGFQAAGVLFSSILSKLGSQNSERAAASYWDCRERIETPDGDWFHVDSKKFEASTGTTTPKVVIVHGLESNSYSPASIQMSEAFRRLGMDTCCINFRGCSGTPNDTLGGYHLGFTDDLKQYLRILRESLAPDTPIYLSGFSLGANVVMKCLGELGMSAISDYKIAGAAVLCTPLDNNKNAAVLAQPGINKAIYSGNLLKSLKSRARVQLERFCNGDVNTEKFDFNKCTSADVIWQFDDGFIAPVYGFEDCWDYYRKASCLHYMDNIAVPTMTLNAKDDPFFDPSVWPVEKSIEQGGTVPIKMVRTEFGGHLGYCFHRATDDEDRYAYQGPWTPSWAPQELARFIEHTHSNLFSNAVEV